MSHWHRLLRRCRKARTQAIVAHIEAAPARQFRAEITNRSDDELIADPMRHRTQA